MKLFTKIAVILAVLGMVFLGSGCSKVPAGHVGVKVYLFGGDKGVETQELPPGKYWIGINEELYLFPTFTQNYTWTKEPIDGDNTDESISFQTVEGLTVNSDVGISYSVDATKVSILFQKYRKGIDEITDTYLRNMVRDALVTAASTRPIETVYGAGKAELIAEVETRVRAQVEQFGIKLERLYWAGNFRLPQPVTDSINAKIQATQMAQQRENEVAQAKAEANKAIETARGEAESMRLRAEAEAAAITIRGKALSENPKVVELEAINKWNGVLPVVSGGGTVPMINVDSLKK